MAWEATRSGSGRDTVCRAFCGAEDHQPESLATGPKPRLERVFNEVGRVDQVAVLLPGGGAETFPAYVVAWRSPPLVKTDVTEAFVAEALAKHGHPTRHESPQ